MPSVRNSGNGPITRTRIPRTARRSHPARKGSQSTILLEMFQSLLRSRLWCAACVILIVLTAVTKIWRWDAGITYAGEIVGGEIETGGSGIYWEGASIQSALAINARTLEIGESPGGPVAVRFDATPDFCDSLADVLAEVEAPCRDLPDNQTMVVDWPSTVPLRFAFSAPTTISLGTNEGVAASVKEEQFNGSTEDTRKREFSVASCVSSPRSLRAGDCASVAPTVAALSLAVDMDIDVGKLVGLGDDAAPTVPVLRSRRGEIRRVTILIPGDSKSRRITASFLSQGSGAKLNGSVEGIRQLRLTGTTGDVVVNKAPNERVILRRIDLADQQLELATDDAGRMEFRNGKAIINVPSAGVVSLHNAASDGPGMDLRLTQFDRIPIAPQFFLGAVLTSVFSTVVAWFLPSFLSRLKAEPAGR